MTPIDCVRRGGAVVAAKVEEDKALAAKAIPYGSNAVDVEAIRQAYTTEGWSRFDETGDPFTPPTRLVPNATVTGGSPRLEPPAE